MIRAPAIWRGFCYNKYMTQEQLMGWEEFDIKESNEIQAHLIQKSGEDPMEWIEENSEKFRQYINANPDLVRLYRENPVAAEEVIMKALEESPDEPVH